MELSVFTISLLAALLIWDLVHYYLTWRYGPAWARGTLSTFFRSVQGEREPERQNLLSRLFEGVDRAGLSRRNILALSGALWLLLLGVTYSMSQDPLVAAALASVVLLFPKYYLDRAYQRRRQLLNDQIADVLVCLISSMRGSSSLEVALRRCPGELRRMLTGQAQKPALYEMEHVAYELDMGADLDDALRHLQQRVHLEDMDDLVMALRTARRRGGNMIEIMERVAETIRDRIEVRQQVQVLTASKRFEVSVLTLSPLAMVLLMSFLSPAYMKPLYQHPLGKLAVVSAFAMLAGAFFWGRRLADIEL